MIYLILKVFLILIGNLIGTYWWFGWWRLGLTDPVRRLHLPWILRYAVDADSASSALSCYHAHLYHGNCFHGHQSPLEKLVSTWIRLWYVSMCIVQAKLIHCTKKLIKFLVWWKYDAYLLNWSPKTWFHLFKQINESLSTLIIPVWYVNLENQKLFIGK